MDGETELGSIEIPEDGTHWKAGRYALTFDGWEGDDPATVSMLNHHFTPDRHPGHGGMRPGAAVIQAACELTGATATYPESGEDDPDAVH